jgi:hypothetical protein
VLVDIHKGSCQRGDMKRKPAKAPRDKGRLDKAIKDQLGSKRSASRRKRSIASKAADYAADMMIEAAEGHFDSDEHKKQSRRSPAAPQPLHATTELSNFLVRRSLAMLNLGWSLLHSRNPASAIALQVRFGSEAMADMRETSERLGALLAQEHKAPLKRRRSP